MRACFKLGMGAEGRALPSWQAAGPGPAAPTQPRAVPDVSIPDPCLQGLGLLLASAHGARPISDVKSIQLSVQTARPIPDG